jgi:peptidoglycan/LPS O-acetylase OafA/YrhL
MGLIRVLLALAVVDFHAVRFASAPHFLNLPWVNGGVAVQSFFVISGFYMALILSGKYAGRGVFVFYRARFLRLYPAYWIVAVATYALLVAAGQSGQWRVLAAGHDWGAIAALVAANGFFVGQDWISVFDPPLAAGAKGR